MQAALYAVVGCASFALFTISYSPRSQPKPCLEDCRYARKSRACHKGFQCLELDHLLSLYCPNFEKGTMRRKEQISNLKERPLECCTSTVLTMFERWWECTRFSCSGLFFSLLFDIVRYFLPADYTLYMGGKEMYIVICILYSCE